MAVPWDSSRDVRQLGKALKRPLSDCVNRHFSMVLLPCLFIVHALLSSVICQRWPPRGPFCVPKISQSTPPCIQTSSCSDRTVCPFLFSY